MSTASLSGKFIANTFQKLLQYDNINGSVGTTATFNMADAISSSKYNLLNGLGQTMPGFVIDTTGNGDGGLMFKDSNSDPGSPLFNLGGLWSIQTFETSNSEGGLNFWRPSGVTNAANAKLFLKNTGSVWVGYQDSVNPTPVIPTDIPGYSFYAKGIIGYDKVRITANPNDIPTSRLVAGTPIFTSKAASATSGSLEFGTYLKWGPIANNSPEQNVWRRIATSVDYDRFICARMFMTGTGGQAVWNSFIFYFSVDAVQGGLSTVWTNGTLLSVISGKFSNKSDWSGDLDRLSDYTFNISSTSFFVPANKDIYGSFASPFKNDDSVSTEVYLTMIETKLGV